MFNFKEFFGLNFYISQIDQFLDAYRKNHPKPSASKQQEISKYARIHGMRDKPSKLSEREPFWDKF